MYPFLRMAWQIWAHRHSPALPVTGTHVSQHLCLPWDIDLWVELNNGRTLTLYDLGRVPMAKRIGLWPVLKARGWGITVAGSSVRYRRRIRCFERFEMRSRCVGWDKRFLYMDQSMWKGDDCAGQVLIRTAFTDAQGIVPPETVLTAMGQDPQSPRLPDWVAAWIAAEAQRPWPPTP